jgi:hypothetical protein
VYTTALAGRFSAQPVTSTTAADVTARTAKTTFSAEQVNQTAQRAVELPAFLQ